METCVVPRTRRTAPIAERSMDSTFTVERTRGVEPLDYDLTELDKLENTILSRLRSVIEAEATDAETLRVLDGHLNAGERELHLALDVQRTHHRTAAASLVSIAEDNLRAAQTRVDRAEVQLARASRSLTNLEAKLARHDPEGHNHV